MAESQSDLEKQDFKAPNVGSSPVAETSADDPRPTQIAFEDEPHPADARRSRLDRELSNYGRSRRRSTSRSSISSRVSRSRANSIAGVPIEFRTLSFQVSESRARASEIIKSAKKEEDHHKAAEELEHFAKANQHIESIDSLCLQLRTSIQQGLTGDAASKRIQEDGPNVLPQRKSNYWKKILGYVFGGFCSILWVGVILFFICWRPLGDPDPAPYNLGLAILVIIVIFLQAGFSAFQDWSTAKTMKSILDLVPAEALVFRDGAFVTISSINLVPGDIVKVSVGNKVPADMRLIETSGDSRFDRSMLTGESEEVDGAIDNTDDNFLESRNIALMGTMVTNGHATGIVIFTGERSVMGHIALATTAVKEKPTNIQKEITRFVMIIIGLTILLASAIIFTWVGWIRVDHYSFMNVTDMLDDVMGTVVAFIPEGMPVGVALTLMMIARKMKASNVLPKGLATVEMLGCVDVLCSDKTGTLTQNKMTVSSVGFVDHYSTADEACSSKEEKTSRSSSDSDENTAMSILNRAAFLCNEAKFDPLTMHEPIEKRKTFGNPTDGAVLRFAETGRSSSNPFDQFPQVSQIPFNSKNKWMLTLHKETGSKADLTSHLAIVKGAPDVLLPKCSSYLSYETNEVKELDDEAREKLSSLQTRLSRNAERVLMFCQRRYTPESALNSSDLTDELIENCLQDMTIIGVLGIFDPPRPETAKTVASCRKAGIRFFMMTGDFGLTGAAIAKQVGIFTSIHDPDTFATIESQRGDLPANSPTTEAEKQLDTMNYSERSLLLEGKQISQLIDVDWTRVCQYQEIVFGRCSPEHKMRIIHEFKKRGHATAVTGDGINDAPALKAADVGIAVVSGSDVALEAADLVLLDSFDSIVDGVRLGRLVFQNLQKVISYLLPAGSWSEIWPVLLNVFLGVPLPLSSFLMIIICVFTDLFLSLSLIMEKEEFDLLSLPPRNVKTDHLINLKIYAQSYLFMGVMETIIAHSMFFLYYWRHAHIPVSALFLAFEKYEAGFYGYTEEELTNFNTTGQCVYFVTLVLLQWGNILSVRNKRLSILQADPFRKQRRNPWLVVGMLASLVIAVFVTEEPGLQRLFGTAHVPIEFWFLPIPLALGLLMMDELRKLVVRVWPKGPVARIAW